MSINCYIYIVVSIGSDCCYDTKIILPVQSQYFQFVSRVQKIGHKEMLSYCIGQRLDVL